MATTESRQNSHAEIWVKLKGYRTSAEFPRRFGLNSRGKTVPNEVSYRLNYQNVVEEVYGDDNLDWNKFIQLIHKSKLFR